MDDMKDTKFVAMHYFMRGIILFSFALFILLLVRSDSLLYYIAPRMMIYVKLSAMGMYVISVYQLFLGYKAVAGKIDHNDCHSLPSRSVFKNSVVYGLFIFPLLLGFVLPHTAMGSSLAAKKGVNLSSSSLIKTSDPVSNPGKILTTDNILENEPEKEPEVVKDSETELSEEELEKLFEYDQFTEFYAKVGMELYKKDLITIEEESYLELLTTIDLFLDTFVGKRIELTGFVYRDDTLMTENQFVVARFAIQCCSADGAPYGVLVELDEALNYADDEWVTVSGTVDKTLLNDFEIMKLNVESIVKTEEPSSPYVYPNYEFGY